MKTAAIIAEYNPFHRGHQYQIKETRRKTSADYILAVISGDFVQRGAPALCNKYLRTRMALTGGADVVIEMPSLYALSSAEFFAGGGITLLNQLGVVDFLSFGSEAGELAPLMECAHNLLDFNAAYDSAIKARLLEGYSYPAARAKVLSGAERKFPDNKLLSSPNNILGVEYCKALLAAHSNIQPFTLKRQDAGYHESSLNDSSCYASASAIRSALSFQKEEAVLNYVTSETYQLLKEHRISSRPVTENDFSGLLHYKLLSMQSIGFSSYLDCTPDLSDKICKNLPYYTGFSDFCSLLKSKDLTYTRISRVLMHILLDIKTPDFYKPVIPERQLLVPYARLLGFRQSAAPLLSQIKKHSSIPLISKPANASSLLDEKAFELFRQDIYCASVYESVMLNKYKITPLNEWKQSPICFHSHKFEPCSE